MWIVQVIEIGTGKLLNEFWSVDRDKVEAKRVEFNATYPKASVMMEYNS